MGGFVYFIVDYILHVTFYEPNILFINSFYSCKVKIMKCRGQSVFFCPFLCSITINMRLSGNKILITGGASGIGLGLTEDLFRKIIPSLSVAGANLF